VPFFASSRKSAALRGGGRFCKPHKGFRQTFHVFKVIDTEIVEKGYLGTENSLQ
jgi:hypothetical protein